MVWRRCDGHVEVGEPIERLERVRVEHERGLGRSEAAGRFVERTRVNPVLRLHELPCEDTIEGDAAPCVGFEEPAEVLHAVKLGAEVEEEAAARRRRRGHDLGPPDGKQVVRRKHEVAEERVTVLESQWEAQEPRMAQEADERLDRHALDDLASAAVDDAMV